MREIVLSADRFGKTAGVPRGREVGKHSAACPGGCIMPLRGRPGWARSRWFSYAVRSFKRSRTQAAWGTALGFCRAQKSADNSSGNAVWHWGKR